MTVSYGKAGTTLTNDYYLVPPARMQWFLKELSFKISTNQP